MFLLIGYTVSKVINSNKSKHKVYYQTTTFQLTNTKKQFLKLFKLRSIVKTLCSTLTQNSAFFLKLTDIQKKALKLSYFFYAPDINKH